MWVDLADKNGHNRYPRPVVILTPTAEISEEDDIYGVVGSRTAAQKDPLPEFCLQLPWHPEGRAHTKLKWPTAVVCSWIAPFKKNEILSVAGVVPSKLLVQIIVKCSDYFK